MDEPDKRFHDAEKAAQKALDILDAKKQAAARSVPAKPFTTNERRARAALNGAIKEAHKSGEWTNDAQNKLVEARELLKEHYADKNYPRRPRTDLEQCQKAINTLAPAHAKASEVSKMMKLLEDRAALDRQQEKDKGRER